MYKKYSRKYIKSVLVINKPILTIRIDRENYVIWDKGHTNSTSAHIRIKYLIKLIMSIYQIIMIINKYESSIISCILNI
jgi:hypothetical protein